MDIDQQRELIEAFGRYSSEELLYEIIRRIDTTGIKIDRFKHLLRNSLQETPARVVRSWDEIFGGYKHDEADIAEMLKTFGGTEQSTIIVVRDIPFTSTCEHHMLPFSGTAEIAYKPKYNQVIGISKLPRLV